MRSVAAIVAFFAAGALAGPINNAHGHLHKRDYVVVTDIDIVYETVWVTEGEAAPATSAPAAATTTSVVKPAVTTPAINIANNGPAAAPKPAVQVTTAQAPAPVQHDSSSSQAQTASSAPASSSSSGSSSSGSGPINLDDYTAAVLLHHNVHRANHSAGNLQWDDALAKAAQEIGQTCVYNHSMGVDGLQYGQNIAAGAPASNISSILTDAFYNGEMPDYSSYYGETNPPFDNFASWGHFSQLVWKETTHVGCATVDCTGKNFHGETDLTNVAPFFTVCNYSPPGNMGGGYGQNIGSPLGHAGVTWAYTG